MGMCMGLCGVEDDTLGKLLRDPPLVWKLLAPDDPEAYDAARNAGRSWFSRLLGRSPPPGEPVDIAPPMIETDLDKAWHGIHYLLTGSDWAGESPLNFLVKGGETIGDVDVGYGPARAVLSGELAQIHAALGTVTRDTLRSRFDPARMAELDIYPAIWKDEPGADDAFDYCADYFESLKAFIADAAARRLGIVIYTS